MVPKKATLKKKAVVEDPISSSDEFSKEQKSSELDDEIFILGKYLI